MITISHIKQKGMLVILSWGLTIATAIGQNLQADLAAISQRMAQADYLTLNAIVSLFDDSGQKNGQYTYQLQKTKTDYYLNMGEAEVLFNREMVISISHEMLTVMATPRTKQAEQVFRMDEWDVSLDSLLPAKPEYTYASLANGHMYTLSNPVSSGIRQIDLFLNASKTKLEKVIYTYSNDGSFGYSKVEINYTDLSYSPIPKEVFATGRILKKSKGKWFLQAPYKQYELEVINY